MSVALTNIIAQRAGNFSRASELRYGVIPNLQKKLPKENAEEDTSESLVHERVTSDDIARVVSRMTGIPVRVSFFLFDTCTTKRG